MDRLGYDGVGFNEHHTSPYGLMNSPNLLAAAAAQRTKRLKLLIYGNLLPLHDPLRLAEELAMLDCLSNGRLISGFARGIPREYNVYNVPLTESRARFEEAWEIIRRAWTEEVFSYDGQFWSYKDVAIWPRPVQQPHPPVWVPVTGSKETIEWAARYNVPITPGLGAHARRPRGHHPLLRRSASSSTATSSRLTTWSSRRTSTWPTARPRRSKEAGAVHAVLQPDAVQPRQLHRARGSSARPATSSSSRSTTCGPRTWRASPGSASSSAALTMERLERMAEQMPWGTPDEVGERIIDAADHAGASTVLLSMNRGAMPHEMFMHQIRWFGQRSAAGAAGPRGSRPRGAHRSRLTHGLKARYLELRCPDLWMSQRSTVVQSWLVRLV